MSFKWLNAGDNQLTEFPQELLDPGSRIQWASLDGNQIRSLPNRLESKLLKTLFLRSNPIPEEQRERFRKLWQAQGLPSSPLKL